MKKREKTTLRTGRRFCFLLLAFILTGCMSPYAGRDMYLVKGNPIGMRKSARRDLPVLGQFDINGEVSGKVMACGREMDPEYFHEAEFVSGLMPTAYCDMARANQVMMRYIDAVRCARNSIEQGSRYFAEDKWTLHRLLNLMNNYAILYESYLFLGDMDSAGAAHKQYLLLCGITGSRAFKEIMANVLSIRMTSMRLKSDYLAKQHEKNFQIILTIIATAAAAQQQQDMGDQGDAARIIADGMILVTYIAQLKQELAEIHGMDLANLMQKAEAINRLPPPTKDDITRAKMASSLYGEINAADPAILNTIDFNELKTALDDIAKGVSVSYEDGRIIVRGNLAALLAASMKIDEIPTRLPPPPETGSDDYLQKYLTPDMYRMAGMKMSEDEVKFFKKMASSGGDEIVIDPSDEEGMEFLNGLRRMTQKADACRKWVASAQ